MNHVSERLAGKIYCSNVIRAVLGDFAADAANHNVQ